MQYAIKALRPGHDRGGFTCGVPALDRYIREQAGQDIKRRVALCYVASPGSERIAGYYTLSAGDVPLSEIPEDRARKLPRYPAVSVARIGRLAIDIEYQGQNLGAALLWDAANKALLSHMAVFALVVDAKDERAAAFYRHFGFMEFVAQPLQLFLPLATVAKLP